MRNPNVKCVPLAAAEELNNAIDRGEIDIAELYNMSNAERRATFEKFASKELAQEINTGFEKAMVSKQKSALSDWAERTFSPKEKQMDEYKKIVEKIDKLDEVGALGGEGTTGVLNDLVADRLGISISDVEAKAIVERADRLETLYNNKTEFGVPDVEYWKARKEMDDYMHSLSPSDAFRVTTSISGRGAMLASIKSPITNIAGNSVRGIEQALERRLSSGQFIGANDQYALDYVKKVNEIYQASGYDISRLETIGDGQVRLGEEITTSQGKGIQRAVGRWYEDIVFKQLMGAPDVAFSSLAFADSANLASTKIAKGNKAKALEIFKDATKIEPETVEGQIVRSQAIADAQLATFTNKGGYSDLAIGLRNVLNNATGNIRLGDQLMPFVKTPANVVQAGIDVSGFGAIKAGKAVIQEAIRQGGFWKIPEAIKEMKSGNGEPMREAVRNAVKSGLGMTLATILAFAFDPDDFVGEYDGLTQKGRDIAKAKNAVYNSIKVGDKYISLDYFGPLSATVVGIMYARKYGQGAENIFQYGRGVASQATKIPGLREFSDLVGNISDAVQRGDVKKVAGGLSEEAVAYIRARVIPAIVNDVAKATDVKERETSGDILGKVQSGIPVARWLLPEKINQLTGDDVKTENFVSTLLFGSRVKTETEGDIVDEISRLYNNDATPAISDVSRSSKRFKELKDQIPASEFRDALKYFGSEYNKRVSARIATTSYKNADDDAKKKQIDKIRGDIMDTTLYKFGYKKSPKQH